MTPVINYIAVVVSANAGYELISLILMGIILASWKKKSPASA